MIAQASSLIFPLLAIAVVLFGIGVLIFSRRRASSRLVDVITTLPVSPDAPVEPGAVTTTRMRDRLAKTRSALSGAVSGVLVRSEIDDASWNNLEEALLLADIGVQVSHKLLDGLRQRVKSREIVTPRELVAALRLVMTSQLQNASRELQFDESISGPNIWLIVGVNGSGKTTSIGKISAQQVAAGRSVLLAAGDTFRAAAVEQLVTWAERSGAVLIRGAEGSDPSSVIFDAVQSAHSRNIDLVIADTAGRLQTNTNLMEELKKVRRVAEKGAGKVTEVLLVIDAITGQNGLVQARQFAQATQVTGVVLSKLDGSAKGGIVFAIETELGIPVKLVGLGETIDDLARFNPDEFVAALFDES
jgi:fused signal recognition particle receptor